ncbi:FAD:protein FMN transferase [Oxalobacteraceae bacterium]|nr:FAD:protein FMN transferase [Oxalobacteraceae bacterium]
MRRVLLPATLSADAVPAHGALREFGGTSMGTSWSVRLVDHGLAATLPPRLQQQLQQQLDEVVAQMSHWEADSDLGRFNRAPPGSWQRLPADFYTVLAFALDVAQASGGAYDPAAGALVNLWGFGPGGRFGAPDFVPPTAQQVAELLGARAGRAIALDAAQQLARQPGAVQLDLSAVAKGFSVDKLARYLESCGLRHYLVEVGGELRGAGFKPDGQPWWVELEQVDAMDAAAMPPSAAPEGGPDRTIEPLAPAPLVLALHGLAVATSGDYRRFFQHGQQRYSHTIDPRSGAPIVNELASVTVVHAECMAADAWSTALTVLGTVDGLALAERLGLAARFVVRGDTSRGDTSFSEYLSGPMAAMLE